MVPPLIGGGSTASAIGVCQNGGGGVTAADDGSGVMTQTSLFGKTGGMVTISGF
jgi:hypothetical protein